MSAENRPWTQGPWKFAELSGNDSRGMGYIRPADEDGLEISHHGDMARTTQENRANGHLQAAAPALYEALAVMVSPLEHLEGCLHRDNPRLCCQCGFNDRINAAVANAKAALSAALPK